MTGQNWIDSDERHSCLSCEYRIGNSMNPAYRLHCDLLHDLLMSEGFAGSIKVDPVNCICNGYEFDAEEFFKVWGEPANEPLPDMDEINQVRRGQSYPGSL